jgi:hypothetical protein
VGSGHDGRAPRRKARGGLSVQARVWRGVLGVCSMAREESYCGHSGLYKRTRAWVRRVSDQHLGACGERPMCALQVRPSVE